MRDLRTLSRGWRIVLALGVGVWIGACTRPRAASDAGARVGARRVEDDASVAEPGDGTDGGSIESGYFGCL